MNDTFIEKIVRRRKTSLDYLKIGGLILLALILFYLTLLFAQYIGFLVPLVLVGLVYGLWFMISNMSKEYEYIVTNGDIDIDSIIARRRRKRVFSVRARDIEMMAPLDSDEYRQTMRSSPQLFDFTELKDKKENWFMLTEYKGRRTVVLFEPDERMLVSMKRFNPSKIMYRKFGT
ncbi:MAG: DUF6106 family protein [Eubacteriales bacterium]|nr:DUF6106 family protein [Eubacteriales bacterium]MDD4461525.1 DUF6106 family protein [Eubacteriales bacterium]